MCVNKALATNRLAVEKGFKSAFSIHQVHRQSHCTADGLEPKWNLDTNKYIRIVHSVTFGEEILWIQIEPDIERADIEKAELLEPERPSADMIEGWNKNHPGASLDLNVDFSPYVFIKLRPDATIRFKTLTQRFRGERLAMFAFDVMLSAPRIRAVITDGELRITVSSGDAARGIVDSIAAVAEG